MCVAVRVLLNALLLAVPMSKQKAKWTEVTGALILCAGVAQLITGAA